MNTVFVVDDNNVNLLMAEKVLESGYRVYTLASAQLMFELLDDVKPDLILLDIRMPEIDGFEALKRLKEDPRYTKIPVIFLTSKSDAETRSLAFESGATDFIVKPLSKATLLNKVKAHLD
jgi:putative two-component system response regulator